LHDITTFVIIPAVIHSFANQGTADIFAGVDSKAARKCIPTAFQRVARRKLVQLDQATSLQDLKALPGNDLHPLKADREGAWAIRVTGPYRICFRWADTGPADVEVVDYHT
jgi:proteic killer suppression protein